MKRWEIIVGGTILVLALAIGPRQIWLHGKRVRYQQLTAQIPDCRSIPCMSQLAANFHTLNDEIENRPWYVWGDVDLKSE
jgi:hypothetical protein